MIILINKSELFTIDPDDRFAKRYNVKRGIWKDMWRRYSILEYSRRDLADYFFMKTNKRITNQNVKRWVNRTKVFIKIKPIIDMGCNTVNSYYFDELEWFVIKELSKNLKSSVKKNIKAVP